MLCAAIAIAAAVLFLDKGQFSGRDNVAFVGGAGTWHDSMSSSEATATFNVTDSSATYIQNNVSLPDGTVTGLRVYMKSILYAQGVSIGLYDSAGNLIASARGSGTVGSDFWQELDVNTPVTVSSGTYKVALQFNGNGADYQFGGQNGQPSGTSYVIFSCNYANSPCASVPTTGSDLTNSFAVGVFMSSGSSGGGEGTPDTTAPAISSVTAGSISQSSASISWSTDESADSQVEYGLTTSYGNTTPLDSSLVTSHGVALSSLSADTIYNYRVRSRDAAGNLAVSSNALFTTTQGSVQAPTTYSLSVSKAGTGSGTVSGGSISCGSSCSQSSISSGTSITLTASAASGSNFAGWSGACSGTGSCAVTVNSNTSVTATFDATSVSAPGVPEIVGATGVSSNQVTVAWSTLDNETTSTIYTLYRNGSPIATMTRNSVDVLYKEPPYYQDKGLSPNTTYTYTVTAKTGSNGTESAQSSPVTATTKSSSLGIVPTERVADWTPGVTVGVPGGIKTRTKIVNVTTAPYNADNTGATDASGAINAAIAAAQAEDVIYMPAGTYRVDSTIYVLRGNITLRGAGRDSTVIDCRAASMCIFLRGSDSYNVPSYPVTSGTGKGSTVIGMSDTSMMLPNQMIEISARNDMSLPIISPYGYEYLRRQMALIKSKTSNSITITPPIIVGSTASRTQITPSNFANPVPYVGFEDFTIDGRNGSAQDALNISTSYGTWVMNMRLKNVLNYNLKIANALNCEIRHSFIDILNHPANQPSGAGFLMDTSTGCLVEDNVLATGGAAATLFSHSDMGNVIAYNFLTSGEMNTNHAAQNSYNLYEGNITDNVKSDGYYGGESEATWLRNWVTGKYVDQSTGVTTPTWTFGIKRFSRNFNLLGNIIGSPGISSGSFSFGQPNIGNADFTGWVAPSAGKYWQDWSAVSGLGIQGTVVSRSSDSAMVINITKGRDKLYGYYSALCGCSSYVVTADWGTGARYAMSLASFDGNLITVTGGAPGPGNVPWTLPSVGTTLGIWPRAEGFQERDLDTVTTAIMKGNYLASASGGGSILTNEALGGETLPSSMYLSAKPSWFGTLAWPPFNPSSPNLSYAAIPAGYRYLNGTEAPGVTGSGGNPVPTTFTLSVSKSGTGSGTVSGGSISCGVSCTQLNVSSGTQITLTATATLGSTFAGWSGGGCSGTGSCVVTVSSNTTVVATFNSNVVSADTTLPTVSITAPSNGAALSGTVTIAATATDNIGVVGVQWKLDGSNLASELTTAPYSGSWNTSGVSNGSHVLTVVARDAAGNSKTSSSVSVTIANTVTTTTSGSSSGSGGSSGGGGGSGGSSGSQSVVSAPISPLGTFTPTVTQKVVVTAVATCIPTKTESATTTYAFKTNLSLGSAGTDVKKLQELLNSQGYTVSTSGPGSKGQETTTFGPATLKAVQKFQTAYKVTPTGIVGSITRLLLSSLSFKTVTLSGCTTTTSTGSSAAASSVSTASSASSFTHALDFGSTGPEVVLLQTVLSKIPGIYPEKLVTGTFGQLTKKAVGKFQESYGLAKPGDVAYGFVGPLTRAKLNLVK